MDETELREHVAHARYQLVLAEQALSTVLRSARTQPRPSQSHIGDAIERVYEQVCAARFDVDDIETLLEPEAESR
jgi:hypothetical protein